MPHLSITDARDATGELKEAYAELAARPLPEVYRPKHGDAPGIIRAHSLDPRGMLRVFRTSGVLNRGGPLSWPQRELVNSSVSRLNQCFY